MTVPATVLLVVGLLLAPEETRSSNPHFAEAETAFREQRWIDAAAAFAAAYELDPRPEYLYAQAQAERMGGECERAITTYRRFLAADPPDQAAKDARANMSKCAAVLPALEASPGPPAEAAVEPPPAIVDDPSNPTEPSPVVDGPSWYRDPWGGVLTWTGVALGGAGGALLGEAHRRRDRAENSPDEQVYRDTMRGAPLMSRLGIGLLSAGGALLVSGIIRYATVGRSRGPRRTAGALHPSAHLRSSSVGFTLRW